MVPVFVDTGAWIAMAVVRDQFHKEAASCYRKLSGEKPLLVTADSIGALQDYL
jgi:predicted nucleic acid-binding protein